MTEFRNGTDAFEKALEFALGPLRPPGGDLTRMGVAASLPCPRAIRLCQAGGVQALKALPFATHPVPWFPQTGAILDDPSCRPAGHILYATGAYYVQDAGSLLAVAAMEIEPDQLIWV